MYRIIGLSYEIMSLGVWSRFNSSEDFVHMLQSSLEFSSFWVITLCFLLTVNPFSSSGCTETLFNLTNKTEGKAQMPC